MEIMGITIFTPTYNRAYILTNLYNSLCNQTSKDFEWLIVDDGSTDNTKSLIESFIHEEKIKIRYIFQSNSGKSQAHNIGVSNSTHQLFTCVDSDDYLKFNAIEIILNTWKSASNISIGLIAKRQSPTGQDITITNYKSGELLNLRESYQRRNLKGDTFLVYNTNIIKNFKFPKFNQEKFVPESYLYDQLDTIGMLYYLDEPLYICDYLEDGYTHNMEKLILNNPLGYKAYIVQRIKLDKKMRDKFFDLIRYESISFLLKNSLIYSEHYILSLLSIFPGWLLYKKKYYKKIK